MSEVTSEIMQVAASGSLQAGSWPLMLTLTSSMTPSIALLICC
jgi:hypothetical protein